ncbi:hypothetical protein M7I_2191 [Glarea lozoyensis 74030]|uniref:Uncharacterized protein n=1 Tax=Glarea lozoyensis (strain ATCC 74030 / MF5533) TaxID=1104152 RepID=H0EI44_GLAL7|nr:hypothetical protein M7I_2191 [Glarea lozoyensis 74030]
MATILLSILLFQDQLITTNSHARPNSVELGLRSIQLFVVVLSGFASNDDCVCPV